jgi:stage II sporulation protein AA (anti-sigma F factor antagonist)
MQIKHFIEEKALLVELTEEIDHHSSEKIRTRVDYEIGRFMPKKVILDLERVNFMDSAGIGLIIGRYKQTKMYGGELELRNVSPKLKRIFDMSGIENVVLVKEKEAIN